MAPLLQCFLTLTCLSAWPPSSLAKSATSAPVQHLAAPHNASRSSSLDVLSRVLPHAILCGATYINDAKGFTNFTGFWGLDRVLGQELVSVNLSSSEDFRAGDGYNCEGDPAVNAWAYTVAFKEAPTTVAYVFRGTVDAANRETDVCFRLVPYSPTPRPQQPLGEPLGGPGVHKGVQRAFNALVQPGQDPSLQAAWHRLSGGKVPDRVICAGHSLGGAMANLCGVWARREYPHAVVEVTTLGSLGVGNRAYNQLFAGSVDTSWQLMNAADPVPDIAQQLPGPPQGYEKLPNLLWLRRQGEFPLVPQGNGTYEALLGERPPGKVYNTSGDHSVTEYIEALQFVIREEGLGRDFAVPKWD